MTNNQQRTARHSNGIRCDRATSTADCPQNHDYRDESIEEVDAIVRDVASRLELDVNLDADMGGTFVLQIDLGSRGGADDPHDRAGIDPEDSTLPRWWLDIDGGSRTILSPHGLDSDPTDVARWITLTAIQENCPAAHC